MSEAHTTNGAVVESLIEATSRLKEAVLKLGEAYEVMPAVIERENKAIRAGDFMTVQAALESKTAAGERIELCFGELTRASEYLAEIGASRDKRPQTLKECVAALGVLAAQIAPAGEGLATQVLRHQVEGLTKAAADFERRFVRIKPQIEANRALVGALLNNVQESYRFWLELTEQVQTAYNKQGVQQAKGRHSGFAIKA